MEGNDNIVLTVLNYLVLAGLFVIGFLIKHYVPKYLNEKAKNFATKEDFSELLEFEKITTKEIESIKGQISKGIWVDQRRWDLKRELYTNLLETFHELKKTSAHVAASYSPNRDKDFIEKNKEFYDKQKKRQFELLDEAGRLTAISALIISDESLNAIENFKKESIILDSENDGYKYMLTLSDNSDSAYRLLLEEAKIDLLGGSNEKNA